MRFNKADLEVAMGRLGMLSYFPSEPSIQAAIMDLLARMCPHREALEWLVDQMVNHVGQWKGPAELRGVLCWRWTPADGVEASCSIPGFTPSDGEALTIERSGEREMRALPPAGSDARMILDSTKLKRLN